MEDLKGLTWNQATKALRMYGKNTIPAVKTNIFRILLRQIASPLIILLIFAAVFSLALGNTLDAVITSVIVLVNTLIGFWEEYKANNTFRELESLISSNVYVLRDGKKKLIDKDLVVPGDIVIFKLGDVICADCYLLKEENLTIDESILTGESQLVYKLINKEEKRSYKDGILYSGSYVKSGNCVAKVFATGFNTKFGSVAKLTEDTKKISEYELNLRKLSKSFIIISLIAVVFIFASHLIIKKDVSIASTLLFTIAIAITIIPEALPVVANLTLAKSALKLGKQKVIVKRNASIEDLGNIEIICSDKTGTLTLNKLKVAYYENAIDKKDFLRYSSLSTAESSEPLDSCIYNYLKLQNVEEESEFLIEEIPFDPVKKFSSRKFKDFEITKGSPEYIFDLSNFKDKKIIDLINTNSQKGLRAISFALKHNNKTEYIGTYFFYDEIKPDVEKVIEKAKKMGVELKIITGDSIEVSQFVAKSVKLIEDDSEVILAEDLNFDNQEEFIKQVFKYKVFARCNPVQKYKIIACLQTKNYVGYIGDGVNDAPSLALANVGIVVDSATDIAKEEADIILLSRDLDVIIEGIREGRVAFENIDKYLRDTLAGNFGGFVTIGLLSIFLNYLPMLPIQILLSNLLSDIPLLAISTDNVNKDDLKKPKHHSINKVILFASIFGVVSSIFDFIFFYLVKDQQVGIIQTQWFVLSIFTELLVLFSLRTKKSIFSKKTTKASPTLVYLTVISLLITIMLALLGLGTEFSSISLASLIFVALIALCYAVVNEVIKVPFVKLLKL